jgi:phosphoribosylformylglycinamidine synthase
MQAPKITRELVEKHGITPQEYEQIKNILGREPNITELGIFSVMWSEHCSYKNSRPELKKFPTTGDRVLVRAGEENAGILDVGDGWAVAFKIESHNHPSAVEPFQGAATGVGGILRDIFTMGARPIFSLNSLRFGDIRGDSAQARTNRRLFAGVVQGIAHYGNCIGVPTVGGEVNFDESYDGNPLVNAFSLGVLKHSQIRRGKASGVGNPVFYVGARTGRDGLAGAAFASRDLTEDSKQDRPAVQVGDPFMEKLLLEACLELFENPEAVVGVQDMGAAGLTCSTCETASRGGAGIEIELSLVPQRETGMTPYEIMLSESQERMLIIVRRGKEKVVQDIFAKWDLPAIQIGKVTDDGLLRVKHYGEVVAEIPARALADDAPVYQREARQPQDIKKRQQFDFTKIVEPRSYQQALLDIVAHPTVASKRWVYRQYDHMVRAGTVVRPGSDAAVVRFRAGNKWKYLAASVDCNAQYCALDPYLGGKIAVAEAARNLAMSGAIPLGVTDNLNFGNPHNPEIFWQLRRAVEGIAEACRFYNVPITGGNVSLYNQSPAGAIDPTPTVAMVGVIENEAHITDSYFKNPGDAIILAGGWGWEMAGTLYARERFKLKTGTPPHLDLAVEKRMQDAVRALIVEGKVSSAHDISEGGLAVTLVECCLGDQSHLGAEITLPSEKRLDVLLFNESQSRAVLSIPAQYANQALERLGALGVEAVILGAVQKGGLEIRHGGKSETCKLEALEEAWGRALEKIMETK